jgi:hypothetical protein
VNDCPSKKYKAIQYRGDINISSIRIGSDCRVGKGHRAGRTHAGTGDRHQGKDGRPVAQMSGRLDRPHCRIELGALQMRERASAVVG